jgi:hypothetical protein
MSDDVFSKPMISDPNIIKRISSQTEEPPQQSFQYIQPFDANKPTIYNKSDGGGSKNNYTVIIILTIIIIILMLIVGYFIFNEFYKEDNNDIPQNYHPYPVFGMGNYRSVTIPSPPPSKKKTEEPLKEKTEDETEGGSESED